MHNYNAQAQPLILLQFVIATAVHISMLHTVTYSLTIRYAV